MTDKVCPGRKTFRSVSISTSADGLSAEIDLTGYAVRSIEMSTGWTAANLTFQGSAYNSTNTLRNIYSSTAGIELTYVTTAGRIISVDPNSLAGIRRLKLRSGTSGTPVAQSAVRTLVLGLAAVDNKE